MKFRVTSTKVIEVEFPDEYLSLRGVENVTPEQFAAEVADHQHWLPYPGHVRTHMITEIVESVEEVI